MADHNAVNETRPDVDIEVDVMRVFNGYPPLLHDRSRITVTIASGVVTAAGHCKTSQARDYFKREAARVEGVTAVHVDELYDDESLRIRAGQLTPFGVYAFVSYGAVVLTGIVPEGLTAEAIAERVEKMPGVRKVIPNFRS